LLVGGGTPEVFDPASDTWTLTAAMLGYHTQHVATLLTNGTVLVAGGFEWSGPQSDQAEIYHPETNSWTAAASMYEGRSLAAATLLTDGRFLVTGGIDYIYDDGEYHFEFPTPTAEIYTPDCLGPPVALRPPVAVESVLLNGGFGQRSSIYSLTAFFRSVVTLEDGAFEGAREDGSLLALVVSTAV